MKSKQLKYRSKNKNYKNRLGETWSECGNEMHLFRFYPCGDWVNLLEGLEGIDQGKNNRCDNCGAFARDDVAEIREEPESGPL